MPARPPPPVSDCPGSSSAPRQDVARYRARSPHRGEAAISVAIVAYSVPASPASRSPRHHRRARSAAVAEPRGATLRAVTGSGGRLHLGMVAGIKSEWWPGIKSESLAGLPRNSQLREWSGRSCVQARLGSTWLERTGLAVVLAREVDHRAFFGLMRGLARLSRPFGPRQGQAANGVAKSRPDQLVERVHGCIGPAAINNDEPGAKPGARGFISSRAPSEEGTRAVPVQVGSYPAASK